MKGDKICIEAKILAVADVVEAMLSHRPYRAALSKDMTMKEITDNKNILYDEKVVNACVKLFKTSNFKF
jgi:HD-GYP domain-containing protein (c-di-GMP phosphodiesterase class II)